MRSYLTLVCSFVAIGSILFSGCEQPVAKMATGDPSDAHSTIKITNANFEELVMNSDQPVLLDFWAPWCGPCVALTPTIEELAIEYDGKLVVGKVNVDEQQELAIKYDIQSIPALIYIKNGEVVKNSVGVLSHAELKAEIDKVISL